jgi:hypothetical protein
LLAGIFGLALLVSLMLPWYSYAGANVKATEAFGWIDLWLVLTAGMGMALAVITATKERPALPIAMDVLTTWAGLIACLLVMFRVLNTPGPDGVDREWGLWVGVICVIGVTASAWRAMRDQSAPGLEPNPEPTLMPPC